MLVYAGLELDGFQVPREGLENPTLETTLGIAVEPYGEVVTAGGLEWVEGGISWFGGPEDSGVSATETGTLTGEVLRELNDPLDPTAEQLAANPSAYYYCAMRWSYWPNGKYVWKDQRIAQ